MGSGRTHDDEAALIAFAKQSMTADYVKRLADWVKKEYPGSADRVIPELRAVYARLKK